MTRIMSDEQAQKAVEWLVNVYEPENGIVTEEIQQEIYKYFTGRISEADYDRFALSKIKPHYQDLSSWIETAFLIGNPTNAERLSQSITEIEVGNNFITKKIEELESMENDEDI